MATPRSQLRQRARDLRSRMRQLDQMIQGSIVFRRLTCGKATCKCARGQLHECVCITYREGGKTKTVYVDKKRQAEALVMCANYKKMKAMVKELSLINLQLVRSERSKENGSRG